MQRTIGQQNRHDLGVTFLAMVYYNFCFERCVQIAHDISCSSEKLNTLAILQPSLLIIQSIYNSQLKNTVSDIMRLLLFLGLSR